MIAELFVPFEYEYMVKAMWVSALVGGVSVDHLGVASAMVVGGVFALAMAAVIAAWAKDDGKPLGKLHAVH